MRSSWSIARGAPLGASGSQLNEGCLRTQEGIKYEIPQFYFPGGKPVGDEVKRSMYLSIQDVMDKHPVGLSISALKTILKEVGAAALTACCRPPCTALAFTQLLPARCWSCPRALLTRCSTSWWRVVRRLWGTMRCGTGWSSMASCRRHRFRLSVAAGRRC